MTDLELALRELDVEWPPTPDLAAAVRAHVAAEPAPARRRRLAWPARGRRAQLAYVAAAVLVLFAGTMAVSPDARSTVLRWLGLQSVEIRREAPRPAPGATLGLGQRSSLDALRRDDVPVLVPGALEDPEAVFATVLPDGSRAASLVYRDGGATVLVQTFRAAVTPFIQKTVGSAGSVEPLKLDGAPAYWVRGAHGFAYTTPDGTMYEEQRLAGNTLLVERGGILLRVEGRLARERAIEIARSVQ